MMVNVKKRNKYMESNCLEKPYENREKVSQEEFRR
jgi:hypothetical protein